MPQLYPRMLGLSLLLFAGTAAAADPDAGLKLARQNCSFCHVVEEGGRGSDAVPSFAALSEREESQLRAFIVEPHPQMPKLDLTAREIEDLVAYIKSLRK